MPGQERPTILRNIDPGRTRKMLHKGEPIIC